MKPEELLFAETHEWASVTQAGGGPIATVGISKFAVDQMTDLVFLELPAVGRQIKAGETLGEVESVKAVSDLFSPVTGEILEVNVALPDSLETLSSDPYGDGWIARIRVTDESSLSKLMNYSAYQAQCAAEG